MRSWLNRSPRRRWYLALTLLLLLILGSSLTVLVQARVRAARMPTVQVITQSLAAIHTDLIEAQRHAEEGNATEASYAIYEAQIRLIETETYLYGYTRDVSLPIKEGTLGLADVASGYRAILRQLLNEIDTTHTVPLDRLQHITADLQHMHTLFSTEVLLEGDHTELAAQLSRFCTDLQDRAVASFIHGIDTNSQIACRP